MSLPTQEPLPRPGSQDSVHVWAKQLYDYLARNIPIFSLLTGSTTLVNGDNHNVNVGDAMLSYIDGPSAGFAITGIGGGSGGRLLIIYNTTAQVMTINNLDANSNTKNQIKTISGLDETATIALLVYSDRDMQWLLVAIR